MLERDQIGTTRDGLSRPLSGGVAPARHALARQRYIEDKRLRLTAEAKARRRGWEKPWRATSALRGLLMKWARS